MTPNGAFAYVCNLSANTVSVINTATNNVVDSSILVGEAPSCIAIGFPTPASTRLVEAMYNWNLLKPLKGSY
jgi:YVTN family beta-propeller protein